METALANPAVKIPLYPFTVEMLRALDPADRHASLVAIADHPPTIDMPIDVELSGGPGSWKVADLTLQDLRLSTEMKK